MLGLSRKKSTRRAPARKGAGPKLQSTKPAAKPKPKSGPAAISPRSEGKVVRVQRRGGTRKTTRRGGKGGGGSGRLAFWKRRRFWSVIGTLAFTGLILLACVVAYFAQGLPDISGLNSIDKQPGITMKTQDGLILASYGDVYGTYVPFEKLPKPLIEAVLATEDRRFFDHVGIDVMGIARAMVVNLRAGRYVQGGSTITQQVAKNVFLTSERTLKRKVQEMLLAFWLEGRFSKQEILAIYLNRVYLGAGNFGIDAASRRYFDKSATEMNLIESAVLTGMLKAPSRYSPISSPERARDRAHRVLLNMVDADYITKNQAQQALASFEPPKLYREGDAMGTRYFTDWLVDELPDYIGKVDDDLIVTVTLNAAMQKEAEDAVNAIMDTDDATTKKASQAALVSMAPDGAIRAMVGGRNYQKSQFNRAVQAKRQPGSVFKLFVYLTALEAGMSPYSMVDDAPFEMQVGNRIWRPTNFDGRFRGEITLMEALTHSLNTVAVRLTLWTGVDRVAEMAKRLGIQNVPNNPSIALGAVDTNLLSLVAAYAHLPNNGAGVEPYGVVEIRTQEGQELYKREGSGLWVVLRQGVVQQMNHMLMNVPRAGTGMRAAIGRPMAGKTGTSSDFKDAWFIGFTGDLVTGVWVGNDDNSPMVKVTGGNLPAMVWKAYMEKALAPYPVVPLANAAESSDAPLPWQEGGEATTLDAFIEKLEMQEGDGATIEKQEAPVQGSPSQPQGQPVPENGPELKKSFWNKLFDGAAEGPVEYEYPSSGRRR